MLASRHRNPVDMLYAQDSLAPDANLCDPSADVRSFAVCAAQDDKREILP